MRFLLPLLLLAACGLTDADGDGFDALVDCDDTDAAIFPGANEACNDLDDDCDGLIDDDDPDRSAASATSWYADGDADGYGDAEIVACDAPRGAVPLPGDCDDADPEVNPGAREVCDGKDDDCDGRIDRDDPSLDPDSLLVTYADEDGDTYGAGPAVQACRLPPGRVARDGDCDDGRDDVYPDAPELCDGIDNDCDSLVDDADDTDPQRTTIWYRDDDGDAYGDRLVAILQCTQPADFVRDGTDCDDTTSAVNPAATEVCNDGVDDDCNGSADDRDPGVDLSTGIAV